jgi:hypothetical protein
MRFARMWFIAGTVGASLVLAAAAFAASTGTSKVTAIPIVPAFAPTALVPPAGADWATNGATTDRPGIRR